MNDEVFWINNVYVLFRKDKLLILYQILINIL